MPIILNESKCLASLAVFRELYSSKKDIYEVISEFIKELIINNNIYKFNLSEITNLLNSTYEFKIPDAVINTSLKKLNFLEKKEGHFVVTNIVDIKSENVDEKRNKIYTSNNLIIEELLDFIKNIRKIPIDETERVNIINSFCSFILDSPLHQDYLEYISAFVIKNQKNKEFKKQLNLLKEGVILYTGIKYSSNLSEIGSWLKDFTIYLDTEILFHFAGFNGILYKTFFDDFYSFIKEINQRGRKRLVHLKYFKEVKIEIEKFFRKAEYIIEGKYQLNPSVTAMSSILDGCSSTGDVIMKKTSLFEDLKKHGIFEDDYEKYFSPENHKYNILDQDISVNISKIFPNEDISLNLKYLNYINILRKELVSNNFENVKYIFLTGNSTTLKIAWSEDFKPQGFVPLATDLFFITNKFWYKLNKGFGGEDYPKTFDIISKAQIVLSNQLVNSVGKKFDDLQVQYKNGKISEEKAVAMIADLRKQAHKPEDISCDDIDDVLSIISEKKIENYINEKELYRSELEKLKEQNTKLQQTFANKENKYQSQIDKYEKEQKVMKNEIQQLKELEENRIRKKNTILKMIRNISWLIVSLIILLVAIYIYSKHKNCYSIVLSVVFGISSICAILSFFGYDFKSIKRKLSKSL